MKAVILAGGKGTRLNEVVSDVPKPMASINGTPFLEILISQLKSHGITDIILSVGHKQEIIVNHFGNGSPWDVSITYSPEDKPLGTGGAIREAMKLIEDDQYLILNGDSFFDINLNELITYHNSKNALVTLALVLLTDISRYGCVKLDKNGAILEFTEKKQTGSGLVNTGIYLLAREALEHFPEGVVSFESQILPNLIGHSLLGMPQCGYFIDIGIPADYYKFCAYFDKHHEYEHRTMEE